MAIAELKANPNAAAVLCRAKHKKVIQTFRLPRESDAETRNLFGH